MNQLHLLGVAVDGGPPGQLLDPVDRRDDRCTRAFALLALPSPSAATRPGRAAAEV